ncbi:MAG: hypothetical protein EBZ77_14055, partial [Chitinophagia bacterium]|nr:hypothetical protein [Chitinophagia bacterium]
VLDSGSTVIFNSTSAVAFPVTTYGNLTYASGSGSYFGAGTTTIRGDLTMSASALYIARTAVTTVVNVSGSFITNNAAQTIFTAAAGSTGTVNVSRDFITNGTSITVPGYSATATGTLNVGRDAILNNSASIYVSYAAGATGVVNVTRDMNITNTASILMANGAGSTCSATINIGRNLNTSSANTRTFMWHNAAGAPATAVVQVNGNVTDTNNSTAANFIDWGNATALGPNSYMGIKGNLYLGGNNRVYMTGNFSPYGIVFNGTGTAASPQLFYWNQAHSLAVSNGYCNYWVNSGTYVKMVSNMRMGVNTSNVNWQNIFGVKAGGTLDCDTFVISDGNSNGSNGFQVEAGGTLVSRHRNGIAGNITATLSSTGMSRAANYVFAGYEPQVTSALMPTTANKLTINNANGVTLSNTDTVSTLELTSGILYTAARTVTASNISGGSSSSYVYANATGGALNMPVAGLTWVTFPVGDTTYAPVTVVLSSSGASGTIGVRSEYNTHPLFTSARISSAHYAKHYWTLTNNSVAGPATVTPAFQYNTADVVGGTNAY